MVFEIYVGNYPSSFSEDDIRSLFKDFKDVTLVRNFKKNNKCFSFFSCPTVDMQLSVIKSMNNKYVGGRNLVVRPGTELQEGRLNAVEKYANNLSNSGFEFAGNKQCTKENFSAAVNWTRDSQCNATNQLHWVAVSNFPIGTMNKDLCYLFNDFNPVKVVILCNEGSKRRESKTMTKAQIAFNSQEMCEAVVLNFNKTEFCGRILYVKNLSVDFVAGCSNMSESDYKNWPSSKNTNDLIDSVHDFGQISWVSFANFPIGTSEEQIYELLSDYDPLDIIMLCNKARRDRTMTEAYVCFENFDICNDVILNFDNTLFAGRILLVSDIEDPTVFNELLDLKL